MPTKGCSNSKTSSFTGEAIGQLEKVCFKRCSKAFSLLLASINKLSPLSTICSKASLSTPAV